MNLLDLVGEPVMSFKLSGQSYIRDMRATKTLNKIMGTEFRAVYRLETEYDQQWKFPQVDWSGEEVYVLRKDNKVFTMTNSEWSSISLARGVEHE